MFITRLTFPLTMVFVSTALFSGASVAQLSFSEPETLSANSSANKTKLVRMGNGWLVSVYGDVATDSQLVYDLKADTTRLSRDNFVKVCHPGNNESQCSLASDWSEPINISNTAGLSSIATKWDTNTGSPSPFYGDAEKPNIFVAGNFAVVTWVSKYCPGGQQRLISYNERDGISVPFSCVYASYTNNVAGIIDPVSGNQTTPPLWNTVQLTDGSRDAKSDSNKGLKFGTKGLWAISWQEDPHGLQIGGSDGPGDGASGAAVTHGTDVWYTYTEDLMGTTFAPPLRISDNYTNDGSGGNTSPIFHGSDLENEIETLERGTTGAARPNLMLTGVLDSLGTPPTAVIAYEESKGSERLDSGKYIRYHEFPFNQPPASSGMYQNGEPGCIISDPAENSRRVRFVSQHNASGNGLRMGVFWKQGFPTEGGPSDIMVRIGKKTEAAGSTGLRPEDMVPAVDSGCEVSAYESAQLLANTPANNISSNTIPWTPVGGENLPPENNLSDTTSKNPYEDARAHRAAIVGDDFYLGYSYAKDWAVATVVDMDNYNFWLRRFNAQTNDWTIAKNVSNITDVKTHVKEPRLVKTPGSGEGCSDGSYLENCINTSTVIVAWGTESNVYEHIGGSKEGDIYYTRTRDKGLSFEEPVVVPGIGVNDSRFESQLRPSPAGNIIWTVWNEGKSDGEHAVLSVSDESIGSAPPPAGGGVTPPPPPINDIDMALTNLDVVARTTISSEQSVKVEITNNSITEVASGTVSLIGESSRGEVVEFTDSFSNLSAATSMIYAWSWTAPSQPTTFTWTATVAGSQGDTDPNNDTAVAVTRVRR